MTGSHRNYVLLILFSVLLVAVGFEHGVLVSASVAIFFFKIYILSIWFDNKKGYLLILYAALFVSLAAVAHIYIALLSLAFFLIPWAVIKCVKVMK